MTTLGSIDDRASKRRSSRIEASRAGIEASIPRDRRVGGRGSTLRSSIIDASILGR
jgi:hypothetical protein